VVNADKSRCKGIFTRVVSNSVSLLDLVVEDGNPCGVVHSMVIDEFNNLLGGSDHSVLIVTVNMGTNEKYAALLTDASKLCGKLSTPPRKVSVACKSIARLKARCMAIKSKAGRKAEDQITNILKNELNYPGTVSKSNLITMVSLHSWPTVLGCLSFLVESAKVYLKVSGNIIPIAFPCKDEQGFSIDRESKDKMRMEYFTKTYNMFMQEHDEYPEEEKEFKDRLQDNLEIDLCQPKRPDEEVRALHEKNELLIKETEELREMKQSLEKVLLDQKKVAQYHQNLLKKKSDLETKKV
jgi:hypothetical protein